MKIVWFNPGPIEALFYINFVQLTVRFPRQIGQDTKEEITGKDFKRDLDEKERSSKRHRTDVKRSRAVPELPRDTLDQDEPFDSSSGLTVVASEDRTSCTI